MKIFWLFLGFWNLVTFLIMGYDKLIAGSRRRRIPEKNLLGMAVLMGATGVFAAMQLFRHKTQHAKFKYGVPLCLAVNVLAIYLVLIKYQLF